MTRRLLIGSVAAAGAAGLFVAGLGLASVGSKATSLRAKLDARHEVPAQVVRTPKATGLFTATLTGTALSWRLSFSRLSGPAVAAHVHLAKPGAAGPVAVPLCGPCASSVRGKATVTRKAANALLDGAAYVNVHTKKNPAGEIRGQVTGGKSAEAATSGAGATTTAETTTSSDPGGYGY